MKLLLDTLTLLRLVEGDARLSPPARTSLADPANENRPRIGSNSL